MTEYSVEEVREWKGIAESNANLYTKMTGAHEPWTKLAGMLADLLERIKADARPVAQGDDAEARSHARMIHDFPRLLAFFQKHALGSKLPVSCFACGHIGERTITHAELADVYVCKTCAERITTPPAQPAERVVEGMVLVPREPTPAMLEAALKLQGDDAFIARAPAVLSAFVKIYKAMLTAAQQADR